MPAAASTARRAHTVLRSIISAAALGAVLSSTPVTLAQTGDENPIESRREQRVIRVDQIVNVVINLTTGEVTQSVEPVPLPPPVSNGPGTDGSVCPPVMTTNSTTDFSGDELVLQAGLAENEAAASTFILGPEEFPIVFRQAEMIFATDSASVPTTTEWTLEVYDGTPTNGLLVLSVSSDGKLIPHIQLPPGTSGVNVALLIDPGDPDQTFILNDSGLNRITVAYRIDQHNVQFGNGCLGVFDIPTAQNAFPTTDVATPGVPIEFLQPDFLSLNWIDAISCEAILGSLACDAGWSTFGQLPNGGGLLTPDCRPSGDWNIRATYEPTGCSAIGACCLPVGPSCELLTSPECVGKGGEYLGGDTTCVECDFGACCFPDGACFVTPSEDCVLGDGIYEGSGSDCNSVDACTAEPGACCLLNGDCLVDVSVDDCDAVNGIFQGSGSECVFANCQPVPGACCFEATGGCLDIDADSCLVSAGIPFGDGSSCATIVCFPEGACCLVDGSCLSDVSPEDCATLEGAFQGDGTDCGSINCPEPLGACCFEATGGCLNFTESNCSIAGGVWSGIGTSCAAGDCDAKEPLPGDVNGDGSVDALDLNLVLGSFGCSGGGCSGDANGDGSVDALDLNLVLGGFGNSN